MADELDYFERLLALQTEALDLLGIDGDVLAFLVFVTLDDIAFFDRARVVAVVTGRSPVARSIW
jgi:hypothetical protein